MAFVRCTSDDCKVCKDTAEFLNIEYEKMPKFDPVIPASAYWRR